jgi:glycosyltransferase involved in cell wall biosynthesis
MEIVHLILGKANPNRMNGVNKVVYQLATYQTIANKNVSVWGITQNPVHDYGERNFKTELFQAHKNPFKIDGVLKKKLIASRKDIIVHLHGGWVPIYASIARFLHKHHIPFVLTPHGAYNQIAMQRSNWTKKIYYYLFEKKVLDFAQKIHSLGESEVIGLNSFYPNKKSFLLPYGFEASAALHNSTKKNEVFTIGFVGRLDVYTKGLDLLIEALGLVKKKGIPFTLWLIGEGENEKVKLLVQQHSIEKETQLYGGKYGEEKDNLIAQMSVFAHTSRNEGLPTSVLEAANLGIPCLVSIATNIHTYVEQYHAGKVVTNEDIVAIEDAISSFYSEWQSTKLETYKPCAQKMVSEGFAWKNIVESFDQLYK